MLAATAISQSAADPLSGLVLRDVPEPTPRPGWSRVRVVASSLNMHDVWTLRGVGHPPDRLPIVLGCDAAGYDDDGNEVIVHPVLGDPDAGRGDETLDPGRALLSERHDGAFAEYLTVPARNLVPKPSWLSFDEAACLPVAWTTAYRMLFTQARITAGDRVLVQGAGGGVASAAIRLALAAGAVVYATSRSADKRAEAVSWGARAAVAPGERLPERVDVVIETVGEATWSHSLKSLRPGGTVVIAGATSGMNPPADLGRIFYLQQRVLGSTGGTRAELLALLRLMEATGVRPVIDRTLPLAEIHKGFQLMIDGGLTGKLVVHPPGSARPRTPQK
ncbi:MULTISPECIES: zinc-binding dehydrogenase [Streptomyces]|uniref:Zinc-binding dehydrogenase n=1 Tax=Streptomyces caniscabiei TaxID=2746961 RepID=A0ABU4N3N4_9ACTN|nr:MULTISPECIES: zinc-binding dehydrogenase [Streptomyces]MBE4737291.1 zinc-binding dehydrogenase [Streptomyces caniscabiei]MBE4756051.1 zinc-binding dehydrogenase [Streptomyces caniscabiei]MBE4769931.1 zinc-binding dehydrogenase [Streptomyces caniscabiei]MBE4787122.1 zinc-binding dehydrogenase [Streptomyces caniscabiei]MBE4795473.1 zinc-binding dehydrogenase [Streptomyces caniscabiei]